MPSDLAEQIEPADARTERRTLLIATLLFVTLCVIGAIGYRGFIEGDATNHYLIARFAVDQPLNFVNVWGRPLTTLLYALPAQLGRESGDIRAGVLATRALSIAIALLIAWITHRLAKGQNLRWPALAVVFVFAQPIFYVHAFSEMTEIPFALVLGAAFLAYQHRQWLVMAILVGLLPLGRPEGFGFIGITAAALVWHRRWHWLPVLAIPFLAWNYAGYALTRDHGYAGPWYAWVKANWPYSATSAYGSGYPFDFLIRLPLLVGFVVFPATVAGACLALSNESWQRSVRSWWQRNLTRRRDPRGFPLDASRPAPSVDGSTPLTPSSPHPLLSSSDKPLHLPFWTAALPLLVLIGHSILWWRGWMGSNGGLRYLVICTPFWALLTARGWEWFFSTRHSDNPEQAGAEHTGSARSAAPDPRPTKTFTTRMTSHPHALAIILSLTPLLVTFTGVSYPNIPITHSDTADRVAGKIADWWRSDSDLRRRYPRILSSLPAMSYYLDLDLSRPEHSAEPGKSGLRKRTPGTLLIWDPHLGATNSDQNLCLTPDEIRTAGWILVKRFDNKDLGGADWADVYLSPTDIDGTPTKLP